MFKVFSTMTPGANSCSKNPFFGSLSSVHHTWTKAVTVSVVVWFSHLFARTATCGIAFVQCFCCLHWFLAVYFSLSVCWCLLLLCADSLLYSQASICLNDRNRKMEVLPTPSFGLVGAATLVRELDKWVYGMDQHFFNLALAIMNKRSGCRHFTNLQILTKFVGRLTCGGWGTHNHTSCGILWF